MAMPPAMMMPHYHYLTPSPQEARRFFADVDDMVDGDKDDARISRASTTVDRAQVKGRPRAATANRQKLVFTDPVAFRYLEEDPDTDVLDRRRRLEGYELYIVEQWACSRTHPTFVICTYTGDMSRSVIVNVLSVPSNSSTWSDRLKLYFDAMSQYHAKPKETPYGDIMVTNLSGFPSALTVIPVPDGDVKKHREDLIVNEDLKRMGCTGRAAINLQPPQASTVAKFHQLYRTSETAGIYQAVIELVKQCQKALLIYGRLQEAYTDGLLCDITERAIADWWTEIGVYFYNTEPTDGILGPSTVAAILGLLIGAYNRLKAWGAPVGKDIFDIAATKRAIGSFQKAAKLERSRRLDRETLDRLHRATAKTASGEGWTVPRAVKSTLAEVSGKGGEMVMGIVGGNKEKAGISEVETLDIDRFAQLVVGARMKWLWQGKSKPLDLGLNRAEVMPGAVFSTDDQGGFIWTSSKRDSVPAPTLERLDTATSLPIHSVEGKSGLGRIREAVGGKLHNQRSPNDREENSDWIETPGPIPGLSSVSSKLERPTTPLNESRPPFDQSLAEGSPYTNKKSPHNERQHAAGQPSATTDPGSVGRVPSYRQQLRPAPPAQSPRKRQIDASLAALRNELQKPVYTDFRGPYTREEPKARALRRSHSAIQTVASGFADFPRQNRLGRQLSFSLVENAVNTFSDIVTHPAPPPASDATDHTSITMAMAARDAVVAHAQKRNRRIMLIQQGLVPFTESRVARVEALDLDAARDLEELNNLYYQKLDEYQTLRATSADVMGQEKSTLSESLRRIEVLGAKLDYELNALQGRMGEVEHAVGEFEGSVLGIERRAKELLGGEGEVGGDGLEKRRDLPWFQRVVQFLGSGK